MHFVIQSITGYFGPLTESAIKRFQEKQGIESVGFVGPKTIAKLNEVVGVVLAVPAIPATPAAVPTEQKAIPAAPTVSAIPTVPNSSSASNLIVYEQLPSHLDGFPSDDRTIGIADDFSFDKDTIITNIKWWGGYSSPTLNPDVFLVQLFEDRDGRPRTLINNFIISDVKSKLTSNFLNVNALIGLKYPEYEYSTGLKNTFTAKAKVKYWLSIVRSYEVGTSWIWEISDSQLNKGIQRTFDLKSWNPYYDNTTLNTAFSLEANSSIVVPAATSPSAPTPTTTTQVTTTPTPTTFQPITSVVPTLPTVPIVGSASPSSSPIINTAGATLSVSLSPYRHPEAIGAQYGYYGYDLWAEVSGSASGLVDYTFYCNRSDAGTDFIWDSYVGSGANPTEKTTQIAYCTYTSPGTYTAKVVVLRGGLTVEKRTTITVPDPISHTGASVSTPIPYVPYEISNIKATVTNTNFYFSQATITWDTNINSYLSYVHFKKGTFTGPVPETESPSTYGAEQKTTTSHSVNIPNLEVSTNYSYFIRSFPDTSQYPYTYQSTEVVWHNLTIPPASTSMNTINPTPLALKNPTLSKLLASMIDSVQVILQQLKTLSGNLP